ncbi:S24 family peptidase [Spirosoma sp. KNUC1025]|uniref:S24 family peptidase n=1 Tax=Spirosoma sp. KNUC1025 TaxID=2894082 RepID=UPI001E5D5191|nr:S24 family peptidase [Spirosoma sp. KNUC1025]UFH57719.1 DNA repair protein [Spirosoma sp. KNUC1025]
MIDKSDRIHPHDIVQATVKNRYAIPLFLSLVQCGFTSPAENYVERRLDLNELCNVDSEGTYFARATGESLVGDRIYPGDILVVGSMREPVDGSIVVVWLNGEYCAKIYLDKSPLVVLLSSNEHYLPIYVHPKTDDYQSGDDFQVVGVVTYVVFKPPRHDVRTHRL